MLALRLALAAALLAACASTSTIEQWELVRDTRYVADDGSFSLELPAGWRRSGPRLTREGPELQLVTFNAGDVLDPRQGKIDLAAPEMLQAMEDTLAHQPGVRVIELGAATLDGLDAFRMHFLLEKQDPGAAPPPGTAPGPREAVIYGAVEGKRLYALSYEAVDAARFAQDLPAFELLVASFRRLAPARPGA